MNSFIVTCNAVRKVFGVKGDIISTKRIWIIVGYPYMDHMANNDNDRSKND